MVWDGGWVEKWNGREDVVGLDFFKSGPVLHRNHWVYLLLSMFYKLIMVYNLTSEMLRIIGYGETLQTLK